MTDLRHALDANIFLRLDGKHITPGASLKRNKSSSKSLTSKTRLPQTGTEVK